MSTPRVIHVVTHLAVRAGGGERFGLDLAIEQRRRGIDARVCAMYEGGVLAERAAAAGVPVHVITRTVKHDPVAWLRLTRHLARAAPHLAHLHDAAPIMRGALAARLAGVPIVVGVRHDVRSLGRFRDTLLRCGGGLLTELAASSRAVARFLVTQGLASPPVVPCGIDTSRFTPRGVADDVAPRLLAVGRLDEQKGIDVLIDAVAILAPRWPRLRLTVAGDGPWRTRLEEQAVRRGAADRIAFAGARDDTRDLLAGADIFCFPSRWEPQGLALIEAQAAGVPVVASAVDGILDAVTDGVTGLLVPPMDAAALSESIARMASDAGLRRRVAAAARATAGQWDIASVCTAWLDLYRRCAARATLGIPHTLTWPAAPSSSSASTEEARTTPNP